MDYLFGVKAPVGGPIINNNSFGHVSMLETYKVTFVNMAKLIIVTNQRQHMTSYVK